MDTESGHSNGAQLPPLQDFGSKSVVVNMDRLSKMNQNYRTTLWTGTHLQVALMSLKPGESIGLEVHPEVDQFLRIEQGVGLVVMGSDPDHLNRRWRVDSDYAILVPAGIWHNVLNLGSDSMKLYTIYAPAQHPFGTVHKTKADAQAAERPADSK